MSISPQVQRLVTATVGGRCFRERALSEITEDLRTVTYPELHKILAGSHMTGLFVGLFGEDLPAGDARSELLARVRAQELYNNVILSELRQLGENLRQLGAAPIILKGPALWGWLYPEWTHRRTRDLDILIGDVADLRLAVEVAVKLGFVGDFATIRAEMESPDHYELPILSKKVVLAVDPADERLLSRLVAQDSKFHDFRVTEAPGSYEISVEVEFHKSFFIFNDGTFPELPTRALAEHAFVPGFKRLNLAAQIPYIAAKFGMDTEGDPPQAQSIKLLADFVRMIECADAGEIGASIELARMWHCERYYQRTTSTAAPLLPSISWQGLTQSPYDVGSLIELAAVQ